MTSKKLPIKQILIMTVLVGLTACNTNKVKGEHIPVSCLGQPVFGANIAFTRSDIESISPRAEDKILARIAILRARINAQCKINAAHDKIMEK